jgi:hypothetical protein
LPSINARESK